MRHASLILLGAVVEVACGGAPMVGMDRYVGSLDEPSADEKAFWDSLSPGKRVVVHAPQGSCAATFGATLGEVEKGGKALAGDPSAAKSRLFTITDARVQTGSDGFIAIEGRASDGSKTWLRLPAGQPLGCVWPAPSGIDEVAALRGKTLTFTPANPSCQELHAVGASPAAALIESDPGTPFEVADFEMGARGAPEFAAGKPGPTLWVLLNNGSLKVRADAIGACFTATGAQPGSMQAKATDLMHLDRTRCEASEDRGKEHVECRSSVGIWEGLVKADAVALALRRRTLGPVHFLGGRPVSGARYAKAVVAVTKGAPNDSRAVALYQTLDRAVANAVEREGQGAVRIADAQSPDVTYRVHVDVANIQIGDLQQSDVSETTQYKVRDEERPNPEKPKAEARAEAAKNAVQEAEQQYQQAVKEFDAAKQAAYQQCQQLAAQMQNQNNQQWANTGCDVGNAVAGLVQPSRDGVNNANKELADAQSALASTPATITVPIMADWNYKKRVYTRATSATLSISMQSKDAAQPTVAQMPLSHSWKDYAVEADPAHNVQGHSPDQRPISNADALIPFIAEQASQALAVRLKAAISNAAIEQAIKAFVAAGNEPPKPGYEAVDAVAFETANHRLGKLVLRGTAELAAGGAAFALPSKAARLAADECLLAVAVGPGDTAVDLVLKTPNLSHGDLRGGSLAIVEVCRPEIPVDSVEVLELASKTGGHARWGLYRTKLGAVPAPAPIPNTTNPAATAAATSAGRPAGAPR